VYILRGDGPHQPYRRPTRKCALSAACVPRHERHQAGFADAIRTNETHHAPGRNVEAQVLERPLTAIGQADILDTDDRIILPMRVHGGSLIANFSGQ